MLSGVHEHRRLLPRICAEREVHVSFRRIGIEKGAAVALAVSRRWLDARVWTSSVVHAAPDSGGMIGVGSTQLEGVQPGGGRGLLVEHSGRK